jgi:hypothetical protein
MFRQKNLLNMGLVMLKARYHLKVEDCLTIALHLIFFSTIVLDSLKVKQRVHRPCPLGIVC